MTSIRITTVCTVFIMYLEQYIQLLNDYHANNYYLMFIETNYNSIDISTCNIGNNNK